MGVFPGNISKKYAPEYKKWFERKGSYENYINKVVDVYAKNITGVNYSDFMTAVNLVIKSRQNQVYKYTRDLIADLKKKKYFLLAISNSPREIVTGFGKHLGFDKIYGRIYERSGEKFTGGMLFTELMDNKELALKRAVVKEHLTLVDSIGVGDTESDISFLKNVARPICFNPNKHLYNYAKQAGWEIVVERKDVVYKL
jgi:phosphoserine phosphatase